MNPALLNYLQANQQNQDQMGLLDNNSQEVMPNQQVNIQSNPFDSGIRRAVETARDSLGMTEKQQDKALRRGLLNFAANISQTPKQKGFFANFGAASRAAIPAMLEYDTAEANYESDNNALANQILAYQGKQREALAKAEEQAWRHQLEEDKLAEVKRYHDLLAKSKNQEQGQIENIEGKPFRKLDKIEQRQANTLKRKAGSTLLAVKEINDSWDKLEELSKNNSFQPIGGYSGIANPTKDFFGKFANNKELQKETATRKDLAAKLGNLTAVLEAVKAGGGKLGQGMYDRLKPNFPDIEKDDYETFKAKMKSITKEANLYHKAAEMSSDRGISIDPYDIHEMQNNIVEDEEKNDSEASDYIVMTEGTTGQELEVPSNKVKLFESNGWHR
jgi:hypothetical protein